MNIEQLAVYNKNLIGHKTNTLRSELLNLEILQSVVRMNLLS